MKDETCESRINEHLESRLDDLRRLWSAYTNAGQECAECEGLGEDEDGQECAECEGSGRIDEDGNVPDLGNIFEYGLSFDYVTPGTFKSQVGGYFRYQLSWGGPSDEIRFYATPNSVGRRGPVSWYI